MANIREQILKQIQDREALRAAERNPEQFRDALMERNPMYRTGDREGLDLLNMLIPGIGAASNDPEKEFLSPENMMDLTNYGFLLPGAGPPVESTVKKVVEPGTGWLSRLVEQVVSPIRELNFTNPLAKTLHTGVFADVPMGTSKWTNPNFLSDITDLYRSLRASPPEQLENMGPIKWFSDKQWGTPGGQNIGGFSPRTDRVVFKGEPAKTIVGQGDLDPENLPPRAILNIENARNPVTGEPVYGTKMTGRHEKGHAGVDTIIRDMTAPGRKKGEVTLEDLPRNLSEAAANLMAAEDALLTSKQPFPLWTQDAAYGPDALRIQNELVRNKNKLGSAKQAVQQAIEDYWKIWDDPNAVVKKYGGPSMFDEQELEKEALDSIQELIESGGMTADEVIARLQKGLAELTGEFTGAGRFKQYKPGEMFAEEVKGRVIGNPKGGASGHQPRVTGKPMLEATEPKPAEDPLGGWRSDENGRWTNPQWERDWKAGKYDKFGVDTSQPGMEVQSRIDRSLKDRAERLKKIQSYENLIKTGQGDNIEAVRRIDGVDSRLVSAKEAIAREKSLIATNDKYVKELQGQLKKTPPVESKPYVTPEEADQFVSQLSTKEVKEAMGPTGKKFKPGEKEFTKPLTNPKEIANPDVPFETQIPTLRELLKSEGLNPQLRETLRQQLVDAEQGLRNMKRLKKQGDYLEPAKAGKYPPAKIVHEAEVVETTPFDTKAVAPSKPQLVKIRLASGETGYIDFNGTVYKEKDLMGYKPPAPAKGKKVDKKV